MLDISKLSIMTREHSFNTIHQILNCFTNCFYLLFSLCLYCSLCRYFLGQLLVSWVKPFRAANRMFKTSALKINRNISVSLSRDKIQLLCQCHCQVFRRWWNSCIIYNPLGDTHNINFKWKTKWSTLNYSNSVELHICFDFYSPLSEVTEAPGQRLSCWTVMQTNTFVDSVWEVQIMQHQDLRLLLF